MRLYEAARALDVPVVGEDVPLTGVSTDSRRLPAGCLFVALRGKRFDGHAFAAQALRQGAAAVMVEAAAGLDVAPALLVEDTRLALGRLAAWHRSRMPAKIVAITGSNGKTTVKEMTAAILRAQAGEGAVLATEGNLNNDIGMPLTLLRLTPAHRYGVIEMGMNHPGEIEYMTQLARPDAALVNNAQRAHLEGLSTLEAVARAKGEIYAGLRPDGVALVNIDDAHAPLWLEQTKGRRILRFGLSAEADVRADYRLAEYGAALTLHTPAGSVSTELRVPGLHNVRNAAAAAAAAFALGAGLEAIAAGLAAFAGVQGRLQVHPCIHGARLIDDTYNANPDSVSAAIEVLAAQPGTRILVLGDMGELGPGAAELHRQIGAQAKAAGIHRLFALGELSAHAVQGFGAGGMHFERIEELLAQVENTLFAASGEEGVSAQANIRAADVQAATAAGRSQNEVSVQANIRAADVQAATAAGRSQNAISSARGEEAGAGASPGEASPRPGVTVLVKGSRFMQMERVVQSFLEDRICS